MSDVRLECLKLAVQFRELGTSTGNAISRAAEFEKFVTGKQDEAMEIKVTPSAAQITRSQKGRK